MKRLVYSPKVYAWVRTDHHGLLDLSQYVVSGMVARKTGMVSTAELTIRNPDMRFTRGSRSRQGPFFKPMDPITIWLERIRGFPVQVFTGYLDETPYLQLYPNTATLTASCTLKRLLHLYWDPALPFVTEFMGKYGWINKDGSLVNLGAESATQQGKGVDNSQLQIMQDGSIGLLLYAVLTEIADWPDKHIHIERLPDKLMEKVMNIYQAYNADAEETRETITEMLRRYLGTAELGSGSTSDTGTLKGGTNVEKGFNFFKSKGLTDIQAAGICGSLMGESQAMDPNVSEIGGGGGYGIAQWTSADRKAALFNWPNFRTLEGQLSFLWHEATEGPYASQVRQLRTLDQVVEYWTNEYERPGIPRMEERKAFARDVYASFAGKSTRDTEPEASSSGDQVRDAQRSGGPGDAGGKIYSPFGPNKYPITPAGPNSGTGYGDDRGDHIHAGVDVPVPCGQPCIAPFDGTITHTSTSGFGTAGGMIHLRADEAVAGLNKGDKIGWGHISAVHVAAGRKVRAGDKIATSGGSPCHVHFVYVTGGSSQLDGNADPTAIATALQQGEAVSGNDAGGGDSGGTDDGGITAQDVLTAAKSAAFVQDLAFPSFMEQTEAMMLTGARSLLNDKPLFPFVEQLSKAAMRDFQSLPNGDFYAFYPDYFGHMRNRSPYWEIDDIEILDAQIQLSDESLATHVFAVGDTNIGSPGIDWFERVFNTGIINISNVEISGFNPTSLEDRASNKQDDKEARDHKQIVANNPQEVIAFLSRYGARPYVEEAPFVRSPFFEAFLAWQTFNLMWARQFATTCTVTFMPELYPGGLVSFPNHELQVYLESVTHTFSYTDGFTTEMEISAPATLSNRGNADDPLSFGLVRGGA